MKKNIYVEPITGVMLFPNNDLMYTELASKGMKTDKSTPGLAPWRKIPLIIH